MAQAISQIRSSKSKFTFGTFITFMLYSMILGPALAIFFAPKADGTVNLQSTPVHEMNTTPPATSGELNDRFLVDVLQHHPRTEVSEVLWSKIVARDIRVRGLRNPKKDGRFEPMPMIDVSGRQVKLMGTLSVKRDLLDHARRGDATSKSYLDMVLLHESVHYEQVATGRFSADIILKPHATPEECVAGWNLEREAYLRECEFAMSIGQSKIIADFCTTLEPKLFDQNLFSARQKNRTDSSCLAAWLDEINK